MQVIDGPTANAVNPIRMIGLIPLVPNTCITMTQYYKCINVIIMLTLPYLVNVEPAGASVCMHSALTYMIILTTEQ